MFVPTLALSLHFSCFRVSIIHDDKPFTVSAPDKFDPEKLVELMDNPKILGISVGDRNSFNDDNESNKLDENAVIKIDENNWVSRIMLRVRFVIK